MRHNRFLETVQHIITTHLDQSINSDFIAHQMGINRMFLHRRLKAITGKNATEIILEIRIENARKLLSSTDQAIQDIAQTVGYSSTSYFGQVFNKSVGCYPSVYRKQHRGATSAM